MNNNFCFISFYWIRHDPFRYISIIIFLHNSINQYKAKNIVRLLFPYKTKETSIILLITQINSRL